MKASPLPRHPRPGEWIAGCEHIDSPTDAHYFFAPDAVTIGVPRRSSWAHDERTIEVCEVQAHWLFVCEHCFAEFDRDPIVPAQGRTVRTAIDEGRVRLTKVSRWPRGLHISTPKTRPRRLH